MPLYEVDLHVCLFMSLQRVVHIALPCVDSYSHVHLLMGAMLHYCANYCTTYCAYTVRPLGDCGKVLCDPTRVILRAFSGRLLGSTVRLLSIKKRNNPPVSTLIPLCVYCTTTGTTAQGVLWALVQAVRCDTQETSNVSNAAQGACLQARGARRWRASQ
jgi:hypothetical protein